MYKVFFNRVELRLCQRGFFEESEKANELPVLLHSIPDASIFHDWLQSSEKQLFKIQSMDLELTWEEFKNQFKRIRACGGIVQNNRREYLAIFRNDKWDLPKGKLEEGESEKACAIREVEEETGIAISKCDEFPIIKTFHVYLHKKNLVLKDTWWYNMESNSEFGKPQIEENITLVEWQSKNEVQRIFLPNTYTNIQNIFSDLLI